MRRFYSVMIVMAVSAMAWWLAPAAVGQERQAPSVCPDDNHVAFHACAMARMATFNPPRTPDGKPDMGGVWGRTVNANEDLEAHPKTLDDTGGPSVVVDPPDGRVPMQPWADAWRKDNPQKYIHPHAACFPSGVPASMYSTRLYQILQTSDYVVILSEDAHNYRSIPLDGRPHVGNDIVLWHGDSRGRWDGNTLLIDTTNQNARPWLDQRARFYTEDARVVERLSLIDANTIHYEAMIDDPNVYTRPWKIAVALRRNTPQGIELWEEACYEGNESSMRHLRGAGLMTSLGLTGSQARELKKAWEAREGQR